MRPNLLVLFMDALLVMNVEHGRAWWLPQTTMYTLKDLFIDCLLEWLARTVRRYVHVLFADKYWTEFWVIWAEK